MTLVIKGFRLWLAALILAFSLLGMAQTAFILFSTADYAKYGVRLTREWDQKWRGIVISYAETEDGRKWRLVK